MLSSGRISAPFSILIVIAFVTVAVLFWWTNTVFSILLLLGAVLLFVDVCCGACTGRITAQQFIPKEMRAARQRVPRGRDYSEEFEISLEKSRRDIPGAMAPIEIPVDVIYSLSKGEARQLQRAGVSLLSDVLDLGPDPVAEAAGVSSEKALNWVADARCILRGVNIDTVQELADANPSKLVQDLMDMIHMDEITGLPEGYEVTLKMAKHWVLSARKLLSREQ
ncbi:MAG: DUF4332 domain-containing protein [Candidatus Thorarchaeota archaeon]